MNLASLIGNNVMLHKAIIREFGLNEALILGLMVEKWVIFEYGDFYYTIDDLSHDTGLSDRMCRKSLQSLINKGILIKKEFKGLPAKQYYSIDELQLRIAYKEI